MTIYFISGLGADERVFAFLQLPGIDKKFIRWVAPGKHESLRQYAMRLMDQIDTSQDIILVGISFGGIVAQEIASIVSCKKVIIISSIKSENEFSLPLKFVRLTKLHHLFSSSFLKWGNKLTANHYFGVSSPEEARLLHQIIDDTDEKFMTWAINQIMIWKNAVPIRNLVHIHGTRDRIFPARNIKKFISVENGGHFMIVNRAPMISDIILRELAAV